MNSARTEVRNILIASVVEQCTRLVNLDFVLQDGDSMNKENLKIMAKKIAKAIGKALVSATMRHLFFWIMKILFS